MKIWECIKAAFSSRTVGIIDAGEVRVSRQCDGLYMVEVLVYDLDTLVLVEDNVGTKRDAYRIANNLPWYWPNIK